MLRRFLDHLASRRRRRRLTTLTLDEARKRVARGAAFLDEADPDWTTRINVRTLELGDGQACVLGQLHGEYRQGLTRSRVIDLSSAPLASLWPADLGFQAVSDLGEAAEALDYAHLTRAWREAVAARIDEGKNAASRRVSRPKAPASARGRATGADGFG